MWLYAVFCVCIPHIAKRLYSEVMLNINNECNGKLTKSLSLFKERGCTVSLALDIRTNRRKSSEYPLSVRFTLERKAFYYPVGGSYTAKEFSDICNAVKAEAIIINFKKSGKIPLFPNTKKF